MGRWDSPGALPLPLARQAATQRIVAPVRASRFRSRVRQQRSTLLFRPRCRFGLRVKWRRGTPPLLSALPLPLSRQMALRRTVASVHAACFGSRVR